MKSGAGPEIDPLSENESRKNIKGANEVRNAHPHETRIQAQTPATQVYRNRVLRRSHFTPPRLYLHRQLHFLRPSTFGCGFFVLVAPGGGTSEGVFTSEVDLKVRVEVELVDAETGAGGMPPVMLERREMRSRIVVPFRQEIEAAGTRKMKIGRAKPAAPNPAPNPPERQRKKTTELHRLLSMDPLRVLPWILEVRGLFGVVVKRRSPRCFLE
ncbi:hypothetical protein C8F04DRAFT_1183822 [Mycena alexandri]|uniref:Uncharacterized protein n=1 Tax=Mycena alexandri TaxID=1745969 RepID=A0AAD6SY29_9AGAR|nr:hypothetical protein C8F04DRAFT_1183822 [Mycena alexandri]